MREVRLYGKLGAKFGRLHRFAVNTAAEAIRALIANFPEFEKYIIETGEQGIGYKVFVDKEDRTTHEKLHYPAGASVIRVAPVIVGAKNGGLGEIIIGAALIAFAVWNPMGWAALAVAGTTVGAMAMSIGVSLVLGGVAQLIAGNPNSSGPQEKPNNTPSYFFNGPVNTTAQGQCVSVGYGRMIVGSAVGSAGIYAEEVSP